MNVPIYTSVTVLTLESGDLIVLEFGEELWFENRMEKSLINPNQCLKFGIQICNDPSNPHLNLGIEASQDLFIPIKMEVSTCGSFTHPTTDNYLYEYKSIILSD